MTVLRSEFRKWIEPAIADDEHTDPLYALPERTAAGVARVLRLAAVQLPGPALSVGEVATDLAAKAMDLLDPAKLDVSAYRKAEQADNDHRVRAQAISHARELASQALIEAVHDDAPLLTAAIRRAGEEVWDGIAGAVAALGDVEITPDAIMQAGDQATQAWLLLGRLAPRYQTLRICLGEAAKVYDDEQVALDHQHDHREFRRGLCQVLGVNWTKASMPWDVADSRSRVIWLARHAGEKPWWPGPIEQDTAFAEAHAEAIADFGRQQSLGRQVQARQAG